MMSAVRWMVASRRLEITIIAARCSSDADTRSAEAESASLISTWWLHRFMSSLDGFVVRASSVRLRPTHAVRSRSASSTWTRYFSDTSRLTFAVTLGLPSRSEPIQLPGWKNAGQTGGTVPALSPSSQSSKRRYTSGTVSNSVLSKIEMTVSASWTGVGFLMAMGLVRSRASISCSMRRSFSARSVGPRYGRCSSRSAMRRILPSVALRRASVGCAVNTGWNSRRSSSACAFARPHSSTSLS